MTEPLTAVPATAVPATAVPATAPLATVLHRPAHAATEMTDR